jgi:hypothetical protein
MSKLINQIASRLRALLGNRREAERYEVELEAEVEGQIGARLLLSVALAQPQEKPADALRPSKLIGSTRNVSETGLAIVLSSLRLGSTLITEENCALRIVLDIYPDGLVEMDAVAVHHRRFEEKEADAGYLIGVQITEMSESDRARYLDYLGRLERRDASSGKEQLSNTRPLSRARRPSLYV